MITKKEFLEKLRLERKCKRYSAERLARELGWGKRTLSDIEKGERDITVIEFLQFCDYLSVSPADFFLFIDVDDNVMHKKVFHKLKTMTRSQAAVVNLFCNVVFALFSLKNKEQTGQVCDEMKI